MKKVLLVVALMLVASSSYARGRRPGRDGRDGRNGRDGINGKDYEPGTQVIGEADLRVLDSQYVTLYGFGSHNFSNPQFNSVGGKIVFKLGKSWEEKRMEQLEKQIEELRSVAHRPGRHQESYYREKPVYLDKHHNDR